MPILSCPLNPKPRQFCHYFGRLHVSIVAYKTNEQQRTKERIFHGKKNLQKTHKQISRKHTETNQNSNRNQLWTHKFTATTNANTSNCRTNTDNFHPETHKEPKIHHNGIDPNPHTHRSNRFNNITVAQQNRKIQIITPPLTEPKQTI